MTMPPGPARGRRLSDKILMAFHQACDQRDTEAAAALLRIVETVLTRSPSAQADRRQKESLVAAYERLWHLRHPDAAMDLPVAEPGRHGAAVAEALPAA